MLDPRLTIAAVLATAPAGDLAAQPSRFSTPSAREAPFGGEAPQYSGRNAPSPPRRAPDGGTIRWNTPNASGNFGGPGTGSGHGGP